MLGFSAVSWGELRLFSLAGSDLFGFDTEVFPF